MLSEAPTCPICYLNFDDQAHSPRIIVNCGHTICSTCLAKILNGPRAMRKCPFDKTLLREDQKSIEMFPLNFLIKEMIANVVLSKTCSIHKEKLDLLCLTDNIKICSHCGLFGDHQGHKIKSINAIKCEKQEENKSIEEVISRLDEYRANTHSLLNERVEGCYKLIRSNFEAMKEILNVREYELMYQVGSLFEEGVKSSEVTVGRNSSTLKELDRRLILNQNLIENDDFSPFDKPDLPFDLKDFTHEIFQAKMNEAKANTEKVIEHVLLNLESKKKCIDGVNSTAEISFEKIQPLLPSLLFANKSDIQQDLAAHPQEEQTLNNSPIRIGLPFQVEFNHSKLKVHLGPSSQTNHSTFNPENCQAITKVKFIIQVHQLDYKEQLALQFMWHSLKNINSIDITFKPDDTNIFEILNFFPIIIQRPQAIERLNISFDGCQIGDYCMLTFFKKTLSQMTNLKYLKIILDSTEISDESLECMANEVLPSLRSLKVLHIDLFNVDNITGKGITALLYSCKRIRDLRLCLEATNIDDGEFKEIGAALSLLTKLQRIELSVPDCPISDETLLKILENVKDAVEVILDLRGTRITDLGMQWFLEGFGPRQSRLKRVKIQMEDTEVTHKVRSEVLKYAELLEKSNL